MNETKPLELLLVEDNPEDLELTLLALSEARLSKRIQVARDGPEALDFLFCEGDFAARRFRDAPKVIFLDLKLPKLSGLEVLRRIKNDPRTRLIPVVVLTSSKEERDVNESYQLGVNGYVVKPVHFEDFTDTVRELGHFWLLRNQPPTVSD